MWRRSYNEMPKSDAADRLARDIAAMIAARGVTLGEAISALTVAADVLEADAVLVSRETLPKDA